MERVAAGIEESVRRILETAAVCVVRSAIDALHVREDLEEPLAELPKQNLLLSSGCDWALLRFDKVSNDQYIQNSVELLSSL